MNNKSKWIKAIGVAATVIGVGVNLITDWVNEQKMDEKIEEKVNEALAFARFFPLLKTRI